MNNSTFFKDRSEMSLLASLGLVIFVLLVVSYVFESKVRRDNISVPTKVAASAFDGITLEARAAYVYDARTKTVLYGKNENLRLPLASLAKVMGGLVALELVPPYSTITISGDALKAEGDSGLKPGEKWTLENLLDFTLTSSSNDGIEAIALALGALESSMAGADELEKDFVRAMNVKAEELGMKNTYFWNVTGLDVPAGAGGSVVKGGAYGTARDMVALFDYVLNYEPRLLLATRESRVTTSSLDRGHSARNTNGITGSIPGLRASKTGFTDVARGNLVIAFDPELGRPIIIAVLGSSAEGRFKDMEILVDRALEEISKE